MLKNKRTSLDSGDDSQDYNPDKEDRESGSDDERDDNSHDVESHGGIGPVGLKAGKKVDDLEESKRIESPDAERLQPGNDPT